MNVTLKYDSFFSDPHYIHKEVYKRPHVDREYIKQLMIVKKRPNVSKKAVLTELYGYVKNFDVFDDLARYGVIKQTGTGKYKAALYSITARGEELLAEAEKTRFIFDLLKIVRSSGSKTLDEFDVNASLCGMHHVLEHDFVSNVRAAVIDYSWVKGKLQREMPFWKDYLDLAKA